jgi:hypothetical protein
MSGCVAAAQRWSGATLETEKPAPIHYPSCYLCSQKHLLQVQMLSAQVQMLLLQVQMLSLQVQVR